MEIDRLVRRTAVGGAIVAGGVVLTHTAAAADEAPSTTAAPAETSAPLKKRLLQDGAPTSKAAIAAKAKKAAATPTKKAASTTKKPPVKATVKPQGRPTQRPQSSDLATVAVAAPAPAPAPTPTPGPTVIPTPVPETTTYPPAGAVQTAVVVDAADPQPAKAPLGTSDGLAAGAAALPPPTTADVTSAQEIGSGQPVAGGAPPPDDVVGSGSAPANLSLVSTAPSATTAQVTGTSPNGQLTITIDQPAPGTVVAPGTPVPVTGTVSVGGGPSAINLIYVIDVSGSTSGAGGPCGDTNADGDSDSILDCEIAGLISLHTSLGSANIDVSVVAFDDTAAPQDLSPAAGLQNTTRPTTDANANGRPDVIDVLQSLQYGGGTEFDAALAAVQSLLVAGEQNFVIFLSDGESNLSTGPGSPLQAVADAGATVLTFAVGTGTAGCAAGESLRDIADATGGTCTEVTNPAQLSTALTGLSVTGIDRVEIEVNGFVGIANLNPLGGFSIVIPPGILQPGRNDIVARAFGAEAQAGQVAAADTFVIVGARVGAAGGDVDEFLVDFDVDDHGDDAEVTLLRSAGGALPATGTGAGHLAATGALSFLLGGLFMGGGRHLRRRRRVGAAA